VGSTVIAYSNVVAAMSFMDFIFEKNIMKQHKFHCSFLKVMNNFGFIEDYEAVVIEHHNDNSEELFSG
jgi:ribosomal protein S8